MAGHPDRADGRFVGRDRELALIADAAAAARAGHSRLVVVSGPAGIGKTTLCEHAAGRAEAEGFVVAWGRGWPDGGAPPLWPWPSVLAELAGPEGAALLADETVRAGVDADRFARFTAVAELLTERSRQAPVAIVLDDAHLADAAALLLARFVIRTLDRCPLLLLVGRRPDGAPDSRRRLDELDRDATTLPLRTFDHHDTAAFLAARGLRTEADGLASALTRLTGGNPLLLSRAVADPAQADDRRGVERLIDHTFAGLGPDHRDVLAVAAILGMEATTAELAAVVGGDRGEVVEALERASMSGLVDLAGDGWSFTHDLVRHAALGVLTAAEAMDAHARALELAPRDDRPVAAARRAHHALRAADRSPGDEARAVAECREAARALGRGFDYERAAGLLESAVGLCERRASPGDHVEVLLEWADALLVCGRLADARRAYERAVDRADRASDVPARARAALGLGGVWVNEHRGTVDRRRVLGLQRSALGALPADEVGLRARLTVRLAAEDVYDGAPVEPVLVALDTARRTDDPRVLAEALSLTHHALLAPEHLDVRRPLADELIAVAAGCGDDLHLLFGLLWRTVDLFLAGDPSAVRTLSELRTRADAVGCRSIAYLVAALDVTQLIRAGRLDEAEAAAHECFELGVDVGDADATGYYGAHLITIRWYQDRDVELLDLARDIAGSSILIEPGFAYRAGVASIAARAGRVDEAVAVLAGLRDGGLGRLPRSSTWLTGITNIVEAAAVVGDADLAAEADALLAPFADRPVMPSLAVTCFGSVERARGLAALTCGDAAGAVEHLEAAVAACLRIGNRPMTAISRADLATALVARGRPGDRPAAADALGVAAEAATEMGMDRRAEHWREREKELRADAADGATAVLRREGGGWVLDAGDNRVELPDLIGLGYLGTLLARPGDVVTALELCGGADVDGGFQDVIDAPTLQAYRRRVAEIDEQLVAAGSDGPERQVARLRSEREALRDELSAVVARSGRSRRFVDAAERARTAVRKAIARAIDGIGAAEPALAEDLRATVTTGRECSYRPDSGGRHRWVVVAG